jgi:type II restriction enzyme
MSKTIKEKFLIKDSKLIDKKIVENAFNKTLFLREKSNDSKGWILDLMSCVDLIKKETFSLEEVYKFEDKLKLKYPNNNFIKDKIRQQLQVLRDKGIIEFVSRGNYKKIQYGNI